jgi:Holliday junction resolvase-like predicted endonuclease
LDSGRQHQIAAELRAERLSRGGNALPRQIKRVFENMGLCWIADNEPIRVTPAGRAYLEEPAGRSPTLDEQVWRYQLPNPLNATRTTAGIALHPHAFLVAVLLACEGHLSGEEFVLFVSRARTHSDLQQTIDRIMAWRGLPNIKQNEILGALQNTNYDTIERDHSYSMAFHHCDLFLHRGQRGLYVEGVDIDKLKRRLAKHQGVSEIIEFRNEPDYIASLGDTEGKGTQIDALDYYIDVSDVKNAVKVYRKLPKTVRGEMTPEEFEEAQFLEEHLEDHLEDHLDKIEPGLKLIGRQLSTKVGPIDLFAEAKNGDLVVLELKGRAADKVFGQICRYMGCIKAEQPKKNPKKVRGYIVGREVDEKLRYAAKVVDDGLIGLQVFEFKGEKGKEDWIQVLGA